ncbi:TraM recognition domain-containing protein [Promicromonospora sukumoe]|uniref:TraM recognition domain-containing protein n=1 Tax=Promicromonospora sukumoe TaxID=88382 RepID=UPI0037C5AF31
MTWTTMALRVLQLALSLWVISLVVGVTRSTVVVAVAEVLFLASAFLLFIPSTAEWARGRLAKGRDATPTEVTHLNSAFATAMQSLGVDEAGEAPRWRVEDSGELTSRSVGVDSLHVTGYAVTLDEQHLQAVLVHEINHHSSAAYSVPEWLLRWYSAPARWLAIAAFWAAIAPFALFSTVKRVGTRVLIAVGTLTIWLPVAIYFGLGSTGFLAFVSLTVMALGVWHGRRQTLVADRATLNSGYGAELVDLLSAKVHAGQDAARAQRHWWVKLLDTAPSYASRVRALGPDLTTRPPADTQLAGFTPRKWPEWPWLLEAPEAAAALSALSHDPALADHDAVRIEIAGGNATTDVALRERFVTEIVELGAGAVVHPSGLRNLPGARVGVQDLGSRAVHFAGPIALSHEMMRTSMLVVGPPGSGKTHSVARPVVENLALSALTGSASVVVIDPKGDDFERAGWFDVTIDPLNPTHGLSLFGGTSNPDIAADRLASALIPPNMSDDKAYFADASKNALYDCLAPFRAAFDRWPTVRELLRLLRAEQQATDQVKARLKGLDGAREWRERLDSRIRQSRGGHDPAASLVERFSRLDRPALRAVLDHESPFEMNDINTPVRVRIALPEAEYPEASAIIARLVVSQFVQTASSARSNPRIFKGLVIDEAGRYVNEYVARGVQRLRSKNAGIVMLTQSLSDFPHELQNTIFGSTGCKAVFGGVDPDTAEQFSRWFGDQWEAEVTRSEGQSTGHSRSSGESRGLSQTRGSSWSSTPHSGTSTSSQRQQSQQRHVSETDSYSSNQSMSTRWVERAVMSTSDIIHLPTGSSAMFLSSADGSRIGPMTVDHRA